MGSPRHGGDEPRGRFALGQGILVLDGAGICMVSTGPAKSPAALVGSCHSKHYFFFLLINLVF